MHADLRFAETDEDRAAVYRLRYELYVEGQGLFRDEADHDRRWLTDEHDATGRILLAAIDDRVVGTMRVNWGADAPFADDLRATFDLDRFRGIVDERDIFVGSRLLVRPEHRGSVIAFQLMYKIYEFCAQSNAELLLGDCEPHLVNYYHKTGTRPYGGVYNHPTNGALVRFMVVLGDLDHLRRIESPMLIALQARTRPARAVAGILEMLGSDKNVMTQVHDADDYWDEVQRWIEGTDHSLRSLIHRLSRDEATVLLAKSQMLTFEPGVALIRKGHASRTLYILREGTLEVHDAGSLVATVDQPGSVVGEVAFFSSRRRMSDVLAGPRGVRVLALSDRVLREIIASHGPVAAKFLHFVACGLCDKLLERAQAT